jgi:hypothetical protein
MNMPDSDKKTETWSIPKDALLTDDPLTNCLVLLTRLQHRPFSSQTLSFFPARQHVLG